MQFRFDRHFTEMNLDLASRELGLSSLSSSHFSSALLNDSPFKAVGAALRSLEGREDLDLLLRPYLRSEDESAVRSHTTSLTSERSSESPSPQLQRSIIQRAEPRRRKELVKDDAYWQRRKKNNDAAKRSRDIRRLREDDIAQRAHTLERENWRLKLEVEHLRAETDHLRGIFLSTSTTPSSSSLSPPSLHPPPLLSSLSTPRSPSLSLSSTSPSSSPSVSSTTSPSPGSNIIRPVPIHPFSVIARNSVLVGPSH